MQLALNLPNPLAARLALFLSTDGQPFTTSRAIAERFGKHHKNVLRDIEKLLAELPDSEFGRLNFEPSSYLNEQNKLQPEYRLSHDGFAFLAMRFTGKEAMAWQIAFLQAFNALETELTARTARYANALDQVRPCLRPVVEATERGYNRTEIGLLLNKSPASISYHRARARHFGLLIA